MRKPCSSRSSVVEKKAGRFPCEWNSATTPAGGWYASPWPCRPAEGPPAGSGARPSALRRTARYPGRPGTSVAPPRRGPRGCGRGGAAPSRRRERARAPRRERRASAPSGWRSRTGRTRRPIPARSRSRCRGPNESGMVIDQVADRPRPGARGGSPVSPRRTPWRGQPYIGEPGPPPGIRPFHRAPPIVIARSSGCLCERFRQSPVSEKKDWKKDSGISPTPRGTGGFRGRPSRRGRR